MAEWWGGRDSSGSGVFLHVSVEMEGRILMLKHFFHFHPAPSRSTSRPHFFFLYTSAVSLFVLWTENQQEELVWGLNYELILGFCLLYPTVCPPFFKYFIMEEGGGAGVERRGGGAQGFVGNVNDKSSRRNVAFPPFALILTPFLKAAFPLPFFALLFHSFLFPPKSLFCILH